MARLEQDSIERASVDTVPALGNDHAGTLRAYGVYDPVDVECLAGKKCPKVCRFKKGHHPDRIVMLAGDQGETDQIAQGISHGDNLCRRSVTLRPIA